MSASYFNSFGGRINDSAGAPELDGQGNPVSDGTVLPGSFGAMQARIIDELEDAQTTAQVQNAIIDAVRNYEAEQFWFTDLFDDGSLITIPGQEFYSSDEWLPIATRPHITILSIVAFQTRFVLTGRDAQYIEQISTNPYWRAMPTDWAWMGGQIRFYPIPDMPYPVRMFGSQRFPELAQSADTNCWMIEGEQMIRAEAKRLIYQNVLENPAMAQVMQVEADRQLARLKSETDKRSAGPRRIRPRRF